MAEYGLQLYSVSEDLARDFEGTLRSVAEIGFAHVELFGQPRSELRDALASYGLECRSAHTSMPELLANAEGIIAFAAELDARYLVCSAPWMRDASRLTADPTLEPFATFFSAVAALTLDDWKWNAEQLNRFGEQAHAAGLQLAYHNHNFEFREFGGVPAYERLLESTDADLVKMELDCGWACIAGRDPAAYIRGNADRIRLLHVRDFEPGFKPTTVLTMTSPELLGPATPAVIGTGVVDYPDVLAAAREGSIDACFVERDPFWKGMPMLEAVRRDYESLRGLVGSNVS